MTGNREYRWRLPTLASYQGQYFYMALILIVVLISSAWVGQHYVSHTSEEQINRIAVRALAEKETGKLLRELQEIQDWLGNQLIEPGTQSGSQLHFLVQALEKHFEELADNIQKLGHKEPLLKTLVPVSRLSRFKTDIATFLHISSNNVLRFPGIYIMQPKSRAILDALDNIAVQLAREHNMSRFTHLVYQARHTWLQLLSEFHLLVANRFSVFSDNPEVGIDANSKNINKYLHQMQQQLVQLQKARAPASLQLTDDLWQRLLENVKEWNQYYGNLLENLHSERWREDMYLYKTSLQPQIQQMQSDLKQLQDRLFQQTADDITGLTNIASRLSQTIFVLTILGIFWILFAYIYLKIRVIKPIAETAHALREEANGNSDVIIPRPKLAETQDLVEAFSEMRRQVWKRQQGLDHLAHHDPLTQLPNRLLFMDRLEHALNIAHRHNKMVALLFLDLDNFKKINDALGHFAGDELLVNVAGRLQKVVRSSDTVARLGGDEFAILLEDIGQKAFARNVAQKILKELQTPLEIGSQQYHISGSIGISIAPYDDNQPEDLLRDADAAMYEAKRRGKNNYYFFSSELLQRVSRQLDLEHRLRGAVLKKEFLFHFQPIVEADTGKLIAVEALMRWQPENEPLKYPAEFMETMKSQNLDLSKKLMKHLFSQVDHLQTSAQLEHDIQLRVSINMAPGALRDPTRHSGVITTLHQLKFPSHIILEITEDTLLEDLATARALFSELRQLGIPLVLDDFGTGQSSLNHLRTYPFDSIKIDREFVRDISSDEEDAILVKAITQLAHSFGMKVVAEGVETEAQRNYLISIGCDYLQGFVISKPLPMDELLAFLETVET
ncbi:putative bifunctional diguanylate cyclase/phosphodiesterase [Thiolapillus sp.]